METLPGEDEDPARRVLIEPEVQVVRPNSVTVLRKVERAVGLDLDACIAIVWAVAIRICQGRSDDARKLLEAVFVRLTSLVLHGQLKDLGPGVALLRRLTLDVFLETGAGASVAGSDKSELPLDLTVSGPSEDASDGVAEDAEVKLALAEAILSLEPEQRRVVSLVVIGGYSRSQIADLLDLSTPAVQSRVAAASEQLHAYLRRTGWEVS